MPYKYPTKKGWHVPKQKHKVRNWSEYNNALINRGRIDFWLSEDAIAKWYEPYTPNDGTGKPREFSDFAIMVCLEIRQVYHLTLRQTQGFVQSVFSMMQLDLKSPSYSALSKRLAQLKIPCPRYTQLDKLSDIPTVIAVDSTGLKRFGRDEWHQEKHKVLAKRSWRKLHLLVDENHMIHGCALTDRFTNDDRMVEPLLEQTKIKPDSAFMDGGYDSFGVYEHFDKNYPQTKVVIPPDKGAKISQENHEYRNENLRFIKNHGRMHWQRTQQYGKRNLSEMAIQRYKRILGPKLHSREFTRQKQEALIGTSILNKMTSLGMPDSQRRK